jgi:hypothetical protein
VEKPWDYHPAQLAPMTGVIWLIALFVMLIRCNHRYANRWA